MLKRISERFTCHGRNFFAVISPEGEWVDSAFAFTTAVHWAVMDAGYGSHLSTDEEVNILNDLGYSIITKDHLQKMIDAGIVT